MNIHHSSIQRRLWNFAALLTNYLHLPIRGITHLQQSSEPVIIFMGHKLTFVQTQDKKLCVLIYSPQTELFTSHSVVTVTMDV